VLFSYAICLEFLVLTHSIPGMIVFEREGPKVMWWLWNVQ